MIGRFGLLELTLVLAIALIVFGPKKLPQLAKAIGQSIREFRNSTGTSATDSEEKPKEVEHSGTHEGEHR